MINILCISTNDAEAWIPYMHLIVPVPSRRKIVVKSDAGNRGVRQQFVGKMTSDKPGASDYEVTFEAGHFVQTAKVFNPNLWEKHRMLLGRKPARTSMGQKS